MRWLQAVLTEVAGLVVDDLGLAVATIAWLLVAWLVLSRLGLPGLWTGVILFAGLAAILLESATRHARRAR
jgi:hypothetical protein